jgi:hypothetical protein
MLFFTGPRSDLLQSLLVEYHQHQENNTLKEFWPYMVETYLTAFPEDDKPEVPFARGKTASGKKSFKRPEGVDKPIREVRIWFLFPTIY